MSAPTPGGSVIRKAVSGDIPALEALERTSFAGDYLSRRSFRRLLTSGQAATIVDEEQSAAGPAVRGYALLLFRRRASKIARLYSFAVSPVHRGKGIAKDLLAASEGIARARGCTELRLEVRRDNSAALALYAKAGYREIGLAPDYYEDHMDGVRMAKLLDRDPPGRHDAKDGRESSGAGGG